MTHISKNGKLFMLTLMVLSFVASLLSHSFASPLYAKTVEKNSHSDSSYPPITPTSSGSSDNSDNHSQYHDTGNNSNHHEHHSDDSGNSNYNSDNSYSSEDEGNNAIVEINTQ